MGGARAPRCDHPKRDSRLSEAQGALLLPARTLKEHSFDI